MESTEHACTTRTEPEQSEREAVVVFAGAQFDWAHHGTRRQDSSCIGLGVHNRTAAHILDVSFDPVLTAIAAIRYRTAAFTMGAFC